MASSSAGAGIIVARQTRLLGCFALWPLDLIIPVGYEWMELSSVGAPTMLVRRLPRPVHFLLYPRGRTIPAR